MGYYERDSVVEACREYLKALEMMEEHFEEKELTGNKAQFMALTYTHLTGLFSDLYLHEQAIYFGKLSLHYYNKYNALYWHTSWILNKIGSQYEMLDNYDTANILYLEALQILPDSNNITYRDIATRLASLSYKERESAEKSLHQLRSILSQAESKKEFFSRCMSIGELFYYEAQFDSARYYLNKVFQGSQSINSKKQAAEWLVEICKTQGEETEAIEYAEYLVPFANVEENQSSIKSQLTELYKSYAQQEQERLYRQEKMKSLRWLMAIVGSFLILMLSVIILYHTNRKKKQHLETQIEAERQSHHIKQAALSSRLKRSNQKVRELEDRIIREDDRANKAEPATSFIEDPVCRLIMERVNAGQFKSQMDCTIYRDYALDKNQLAALRNAADHHFNQFTVRISKAHPELTRSDLDYCCLYLLGLSDADVAALMQRAYNTVNERNSKLRRIFGSESPISVTLQTIANEATFI